MYMQDIYKLHLFKYAPFQIVLIDHCYTGKVVSVVMCNTRYNQS